MSDEWWFSSGSVSTPSLTDYEVLSRPSDDDDEDEGLADAVSAAMDTDDISVLSSLSSNDSETEDNSILERTLDNVQQVQAILSSHDTPVIDGGVHGTPPSNDGGMMAHLFGGINKGSSEGNFMNMLTHWWNSSSELESRVHISSIKGLTNKLYQSEDAIDAILHNADSKPLTYMDRRDPKYSSMTRTKRSASSCARIPQSVSDAGAVNLLGMGAVNSSDNSLFVSLAKPLLKLNPALDVWCYRFDNTSKSPILAGVVNEASGEFHSTRPYIMSKDEWDSHTQLSHSLKTVGFIYYGTSSSSLPINVFYAFLKLFNIPAFSITDRPADPMANPHLLTSLIGPYNLRNDARSWPPAIIPLTRKQVFNIGESEFTASYLDQFGNKPEWLELVYPIPIGLLLQIGPDPNLLEEGDSQPGSENLNQHQSADEDSVNVLSEPYQRSTDQEDDEMSSTSDDLYIDGFDKSDKGIPEIPFSNTELPKQREGSNLLRYSLISFFIFVTMVLQYYQYNWESSLAPVDGKSVLPSGSSMLAVTATVSNKVSNPSYTGPHAQTDRRRPFKFSDTKDQEFAQTQKAKTNEQEHVLIYETESDETNLSTTSYYGDSLIPMAVDAVTTVTRYLNGIWVLFFQFCRNQVFFVAESISEAVRQIGGGSDVLLVEGTSNEGHSLGGDSVKQDTLSMNVGKSKSEDSIGPSKFPTSAEEHADKTTFSSHISEWLRSTVTETSADPTEAAAKVDSSRRKPKNPETERAGIKSKSVTETRTKPDSARRKLRSPEVDEVTRMVAHSLQKSSRTASVIWNSARQEVAPYTSRIKDMFSRFFDTQEAEKYGQQAGQYISEFYWSAKEKVSFYGEVLIRDTQEWTSKTLHPAAMEGFELASLANEKGLKWFETGLRQLYNAAEKTPELVREARIEATKLFETVTELSSDWVEKTTKMSSVLIDKTGKASSELYGGMVKRSSAFFSAANKGGFKWLDIVTAEGYDHLNAVVHKGQDLLYSARINGAKVLAATRANAPKYFESASKSGHKLYSEISKQIAEAEYNKLESVRHFFGEAENRVPEIVGSAASSSWRLLSSGNERTRKYVDWLNRLSSTVKKEPREGESSLNHLSGTANQEPNKADCENGFFGLRKRRSGGAFHGGPKKDYGCGTGIKGWKCLFT